MQEDLLENLYEGKIYSKRTIVVATVFGGLLAGIYLIAENFKTFRQPQKAKLTWLAGVAILVIAVTSSYLPVLGETPDVLYVLFFTFLSSYITYKYQGKLITNHLENGGQEHTTGRVVAIVILGLVITVLLLAIPFLIMDFYFTPSR